MSKPSSEPASAGVDPAGDVMLVTGAVAAIALGFALAMIGVW